MATTRKRTLPSGKTVWQADYRDGEGKRRSKQFALKKEADAFLLKARGEVASGTHVADTRSITVEDAAALWLDRARAEGLEPATIASYDQHVRLHIVPLLGPKRLNQVTAPVVEAFKDELLRTRSRPMAKRVVTSLSGIFSEAMRRGRAAYNPVEPVKVRKDKRTSKRPEMPTKAELRTMLTGAPEKWKPFLYTAVFTGLRASELRGLRWCDVDLDKGVLSVRQRADVKRVIGPPKSEAGTRDIPLAAVVVESLKAWKPKCPKGELDLVFPNGQGAVEFHQNLLNRFFWPLQIGLGITRTTDEKDEDGNPVVVAKYGLHALRHAAAALFIEQGLKPKRVQVLMGHQSIQVTMDVYGYLFPNDEDDSVAMGAIAAGLLG